MRVASIVFIFALTACRPDAFICATDGDCGDAGVCEASGDCSFPDDGCDSGRRFGGYASAEVAGACVPVEGTEIAVDSEGCDCDAAPPPGWEGPVVVVADVESPQCPADSEEVLALFDELVVPEPACDCRCDAGSQCDAADLWSGGEGCFYVAVASPGLDACTDLQDHYAIGIRWNLDEASCVADDRSVVEPVRPQHRFALCSPTANDACADGSCGEMCIHRPGMHACPSGFDERRVLHAGFVDDRVCTPCDCGADGEVICAAQFFQDGACEYELEDRPASPDGDACTWEEAGLGSVRIVDDSTCAPTGGEPIGDAVTKDPVTVCCSE